MAAAPGVGAGRKKVDVSVLALNSPSQIYWRPPNKFENLIVNKHSLTRSLFQPETASKPVALATVVPKLSAIVLGRAPSQEDRNSGQVTSLEWPDDNISDRAWMIMKLEFVCTDGKRPAAPRRAVLA